MSLKVQDRRQVPAWLRTWVPEDWYPRYGQSFDTYHLPRKHTERRALALRTRRPRRMANRAPRWGRF
jgi:hypothetical protein